MLILLIVLKDLFPHSIFVIAFLLVSFRFIGPGFLALSEYIDTDYSKLLNTIIWSFIVCAMYYIDNYVHQIFKGAGLTLVVIFSYFIIVRGTFYLLNKEEPIYKYYLWQTGDFIKARKRNLTSYDSQFTNTIRIGYVIIIIALLNSLST